MKKKTAKASQKPAKAKAKTPVIKAGLVAIRKKLLVMREDLMGAVRRQQLPESVGGDSGDSVDQASLSIEKELLFELSDNERVTLDQIEAALRKIEKGTYGLCESCRKPIAKVRLSALPFARYCISCQSSSEKVPDSTAVEAVVPEFQPVGEEVGREV